MKTQNTLILVAIAIVIIAAAIFFFTKDKGIVDAVMGTDDSAIASSTTETTGTTPQTTTSGTSGSTSEAPDFDADGALVIRYSDTGFTPSEFQVYAGTQVRFVNNNNTTLRVVGTRYKSGDVHPGFDAVASVGVNESYIFTFTQTGIWSFKNLNDATHVGTIIVLDRP